MRLMDERRENKSYASTTRKRHLRLVVCLCHLMTHVQISSFTYPTRLSYIFMRPADVIIKELLPLGSFLRVVLSNYCPINPPRTDMQATSRVCRLMTLFCSQSASLSDGSSPLKGLHFLVLYLFAFFHFSAARRWRGNKHQARGAWHQLLSPRKAHSIKINPLILNNPFICFLSCWLFACV